MNVIKDFSIEEEEIEMWVSESLSETPGYGYRIVKLGEIATIYMTDTQAEELFKELDRTLHNK